MDRAAEVFAEAVEAADGLDPLIAWLAAVDPEAARARDDERRAAQSGSG